jgi:3-ketosteroid 9alpha-monooxygenase subunit A
VTTETAGIREIDTGALPDRYARGWHCLGPVKDYLDGKPHGIEIFGTMLVVFADSHGDVKVLDGYCRHMGGNLAQGTIKGDEVACPFHDWRWGGDGKCKLVPYAKRTPRLARTRAWHTDVRGGLLFVWHDHEGNPPQPEVQVPDIPESASDEWTEWRWNSILIEGSNCRDIIDNVTDMAHFFYIHFGLPTYFKNVFEGHIASQYLHNVGRPDVNDLGTSYGEAHLDSEASYFGPSFMINWLHNSYGGFKAESILINCHYPVTQLLHVAVGRHRREAEGARRGDHRKAGPGVYRRGQQGLPAGRRDLAAQDAHRQSAAGRGGRRRLSDAPLVSAVLCGCG